MLGLSGSSERMTVMDEKELCVEGLDVARLFTVECLNYHALCSFEVTSGI